MIMTHERRVLLISNSTEHGRGFLDHVESDVRDVLEGVARVVFVPYALFDRDAYAGKVEARFARMGIEVDAIHRAEDPERAIDRAEAVFVGGGNTFRLLDALHRARVMPRLRARVEAGMPYIGSSAGAIVAGPTLKTTKDMPIVEPPSFEALGLVAFQISPHYLDPDPSSTHMGETQEERILTFLEENDAPVIGLREGSSLRIEGRAITLRGARHARLFRRGRPPIEAAPGEALSAILEPAR
jgi:dipeptidase E